jgi:leader peptidase (prepilin peptidase)/N-methyltransferase
MIWILGLCGLVTGILINLCADSLPVDRRLHRPTCAQCQHPRPAIAWSGLLAHITRRHTCENCGTRLSIRHLFVELGTAGLFMFCWLRGGTPFVLATRMLYGSAFILVLITDLEHKLIPHVVMLPAIAIAIIATFINPDPSYPARGLLGGAGGLVSALVLYVFGALFARLAGRMRGQTVSEVAFGFGDVTLITFIGFAVGVPDIIFALVIGILSGGIVAVLFLFVRGLIQKKYAAFTAIPYGPFLILGGSVMLYFGQEFMTWYSNR